ncbi:MAG: dTDP-4-dehydrorhamnose reductase [Candidatus Zixiibacteriota bacterium]|nr:MAG: dTDP-4-dehydrorhamnose reductase [candidate division Zixibacteria bacterium]
MSKQSKVLVLGAGGQLGTAITKICGNGGPAVTPLRRSDFDADRHEPAEMLAAYADHDYLVNCIAYHKVDRCEDNFAESFRINGELVMKLARFCAGHDLTFMHISTDYVFDGVKKEPYREDDLPAPLNVYGASKLAGEMLAAAYCPKHFVLRVSSLFGEREIRPAEVNFVEKMVRAARENRPLRVIDNQVMSPTFTDDVARVIRFLVEDDVSGYGLYHACNGGECTWFEFAQKIFELTGLENDLTPVSYAEFHSYAQRPQFCSMDNSRLGRLYPMRPWAQALEDYLQTRGYLARSR